MAEEAKVAEETIEAEEAEEKAAKEAAEAAKAEKEAAREKTAKEKLEEEKARIELEELRKEQKGKKWNKAKEVATSSDILIFLLIFIGGIAHLLKYFTAWKSASYFIDAALAVYVGIVIFAASQQKNPILRIIYSAALPVALFVASQGVVYILVKWLPIVRGIPGLDFTFDPKFWPWWAIYAIWSDGVKKEGHPLSKILMIAHGVTVFFLVFWPMLSPGVLLAVEQAQAAREEVEARGMTSSQAYGACVGEMLQGKLTNLDLQTCAQRKMHPPPEEEIRAATIGRIKRALRQAVTASITIDPNQLFFLPKDQTTMRPEVRGRISATSINKNITINLNCLIENKAAEMTLPKWTVKQSEIGDSEQFTCTPKEALKEGEYEIKATGNIPDLEVNSIVINFFIDADVLRTEQERFITSKDPTNLKIIEQWSKMKASTAPYSRDKAENFLNKEIFKSYIRAIYPDLKVQSESDPGYVKLNLMTERIYPEAPESSAVIALTEDINFEIGIVNNLKFGKILKINSGSFEEFPPFLAVKPDESCPINPDLSLDTTILNKEPWEKIEYQKEKSFLCKLRYKGGIENPEEIQTAAFSLTINYDYQIEKKGEFEIKEAS